MDRNEFITETKRIFALNPCVDMPSDEIIEQLFLLTEIMLEVNAYMNLTAIKDTEGIILKHYVDSLTASNYIPYGATVIDVGCGAGFPSLPLAIYRPDVRITPLDSTEKRIRYVNETANKLGLSNVNAVTARAEEFAKLKTERESYDVAIARAVADLPILTELCLPFVKIGGAFIAMKAAKADEELSNSLNAIRLCGGDEPKTVSVDLSADGSAFESRRLIMSTKVRNTPELYPRNFGRIQKKPL